METTWREPAGWFNLASFGNCGYLGQLSLGSNLWLSRANGRGWVRHRERFALSPSERAPIDRALRTQFDAPSFSSSSWQNPRCSSARHVGILSSPRPFLRAKGTVLLAHYVRRVPVCPSRVASNACSPALGLLLLWQNLRTTTSRRILSLPWLSSLGAFRTKRQDSKHLRGTAGHCPKMHGVSPFTRKQGQHLISATFAMCGAECESYLCLYLCISILVVSMGWLFSRVSQMRAHGASLSSSH